MNNEALRVSNRSEYSRHSQISTVIWALVLIWAGIVFFAENFGWLDRIAVTTRGGMAGFFHMGAWALIFTGAGFLVLFGVALRLISPGYRDSVSGQLVLAGVLFGIGLSRLVGWQVLWPLVIIAVGLSTLLGAFLRSR